MNRRSGFWIAVVGLHSVVAFAQEVSPRRLAARLCENQSDYATRVCIKRDEPDKP